MHAFLAAAIDRSEFVRRLCATGVTAGAAFSFAELLTGYRAAMAATGSVATTPAALAPGEFALLEAIAERILPTTDTPGAREAGAVHYIDIALAGAYKTELARYRSGLAALQAHCRNSLGGPFESLAPDAQDAVLVNLEAGHLADVEAGAPFFALMRRHVMEGFFCDPSYGGNHDMVGWKLVGFPGAQHGYAQPYIDRVVDIAPVALTNASAGRR
ncbi:MAG: gluconate 2-dehydrogenase subunit 3 family protein [Candidatus Lustribacter sp.]